MTAVQAGPPQSAPEGRYGPGPDAKADRRLKIAGLVAAGLAVLVIGWFGYASITSSKVSAQVVAFQAVSDQSLQIHLEVHKDAGDVAVCTVRSEDVDHNEVGRKDVRIAQHGRQVDTVVTLRTTARGQTGEIVGCEKAPHS